MPHRRDAIACHRLDDEAVLYDLAHHTVHYLNRTACFIWDRCDGRHRVEEVVSEMTRSFAADNCEHSATDEFRSHLATTLATFQENGVLNDGGDA